MKKTVVVLAILLSLVMVAQGHYEIITQIKDPRGDDWGAGALRYPDHQVYIPGLFDLLQFDVGSDDAYVYFDFRFAELTNPFQAPEGYFHQRIEVYITTGEDHGRSSMQIGHYQFETAPGKSWDLNLSIAPFAESRLYVVDSSGMNSFSDGISCFVLPDGRTIRFRAERSLLPYPNSTWGYYVLVGAFDGLATNFWRDVGEGTWQVGGEGFPIFDLLAPRLGPGKQKSQLTSGVLYPIYAGKTHLLLWAAGGLIILLAGFFLWRWFRGRT